MVKVALITGGSSGIGNAVAIEYAKLGYKVAITGKQSEDISEIVKQLEAHLPDNCTDHILTIEADFEIPAQVEPIVEKVVEKFGRLDILVNNAGYTGNKSGLMDDKFFDDFQKILQVNLVAPTRIAQLAIKHLTKTRGVIINVSSICDRIAVPNISYSVSKAGITMLTKTLANALEGTGIRVVTVAPGPIRTNFSQEMDAYARMSSLNRIGEAKEVANAISFLSSDKASYIHGCTVDVDGGSYSKFAGLIDTEWKISEVSNKC